MNDKIITWLSTVIVWVLEAIGYIAIEVVVVTLVMVTILHWIYKRD